LAPERIRCAGGGRRSLIRHNPRLPALLESLVEPLTRGDPESPLCWTCKSTRTLADELTGRRHAISHEKVAQLLRQMNYSLQSNRLLITADGGGSNGCRVRLWKWELQRLADQTGLEIAVCHFPPGTSKWNKVEHRLFSFISSNWRGEPLRDYETVVGLIACTTTVKGLKVNYRLDRRRYQPGRKITPEQMASIHLKPERFHGEWNYVIYRADKL